MYSYTLYYEVQLKQKDEILVNNFMFEIIIM